MEKQLDTEAARGGDEAFEAFGIKIPGSRVTRLGIVVLLGVQLYFVMYLKRLWNKLKPEDPGWEVPWMAMDESPMARTMLFVSVVVLPCVAAFCLLFQEWRIVVDRGWGPIAILKSHSQSLLMVVGYPFECPFLEI